jgi:hypothetical protein
LLEMRVVRIPLGTRKFDGEEFWIIQPLKHNFNVDIIRQTDLKDERRMWFVQDRVQWRNVLFWGLNFDLLLSENEGRY